MIDTTIITALEFIVDNTKIVAGSIVAIIGAIVTILKLWKR